MFSNLVVELTYGSIGARGHTKVVAVDDEAAPPAACAELYQEAGRVQAAIH